MEEAITRNSLYGFEMREPDLRRKEDRKTHNIKQLWQRSHEILALALRGLKQTQIAELLDITPQTVSNVLNSELGMKKISKMRLNRDEEAIHVSERISELTEKALDTYEKIFDSDNASDETKRKTSDTVMLELSGYRVPTKIQSSNITATLDEIEEFKKRGIAAARESGMIVVVENESKPSNGGQASHGIYDGLKGDKGKLDGDDNDDVKDKVKNFNGVDKQIVQLLNDLKPKTKGEEK